MRRGVGVACAAAAQGLAPDDAPARPSSWSVSHDTIGPLEKVRDYALEVLAGRAHGWTRHEAEALHNRAQLALNDALDRGLLA